MVLEGSKLVGELAEHGGQEGGAPHPEGLVLQKVESQQHQLLGVDGETRQLRPETRQLIKQCHTEGPLAVAKMIRATGREESVVAPGPAAHWLAIGRAANIAFFKEFDS